MVSFDPYLNWLGIPPHEQPPNYYRLLGVVLFESNPQVIEQAADHQSLRVGAYQGGPQSEMCQQLLSEIAMAQFCLLDPQQKAAYDAQLQGGLAQRGERSVAPPPPAWSAGEPQGHTPQPQYAPQGGVGGGHPGQTMQSPMPAPMVMPGPQPMSMAPTMMSGPPGFAPAMPRPAAPAAMPVAAPFPTATAVVARPVAQSAAPPAQPPSAPPRPIDELENLAAQPATKRRFFKKKKEDYTQQIIIGSIVAAAGVLLFIVWAAVKSQDPSEHGLGGVVPEKTTVDLRTKLAEERKLKAKEIEKEKKEKKEREAKEREEKEKEKEKKTGVARSPASGGAAGPLRSFVDDGRHPNAHSDDGDSGVTTPHKFGPPTRSMDSPDGGGPVQVVPQPNGHDNPRDLGGDNDPVMGKDPAGKDP